MSLVLRDHICFVTFDSSSMALGTMEDILLLGHAIGTSHARSHLGCWMCAKHPGSVCQARDTRGTSAAFLCQICYTVFVLYPVDLIWYTYDIYIYIHTIATTCTRNIIYNISHSIHTWTLLHMTSKQKVDNGFFWVFLVFLGFFV